MVAVDTCEGIPEVGAGETAKAYDSAMPPSGAPSLVGAGRTAVAQQAAQRPVVISLRSPTPARQ
ncbi:MAG: hypothetical protein IPG34_07330 [Rhodocyclaceae bacterium]|nr:hypothetical protein [Rhodocyclaceae bacterium]